MSKGSIRFSIQVPGATNVAAWKDKVRRAEEQGFFSVSVPDHLSPDLPQLAPFVALAAAAMVTSRLRLAITVLNNDLRHPVMMAKEVATLDLLSEGRLDVGLGAGWLATDYTSSGIRSFDPPAERVARLEESVSLLRDLLSGREVTYDGRYYQLTGFASYPVPRQTHLPIMIGGAGRRMLTMAARHADIVSIVVNDPKVDSSLKAFEERIRWVTEATPSERAALTLGVRIVIGAVAGPGISRETAADEMASKRGILVSNLLDSPFVLVGDLPAIKDRILELRERYGLSYFTVSEDFAWQLGDLVADLSGAP